MNHVLLRPLTTALVGASLLMGGAVQAADIPLSFVQLTGTVAQGTTIFRADLSGLSMEDIASIRLTDSNSQLGGSPGAFSGFDLDAIKISSTLAATAGDASAALGLNVFDFSPTGTLFSPGTQRAPAAPKLNGTDASGTQVDAAFATLGAFDAVFFAEGSVTLGDGGSIGFNLSSPVDGDGLYLYVGEVGLGAGEGLDALITVSTTPITPSIPEPGTYALMGLGLLGLAAASRRRAPAR